MKKLITEFRLIHSLANRDENELIDRIELVETPSENEIVNINGEPYIVFGKSWGFSDDCNTDYCYIVLISR